MADGTDGAAVGDSVAVADGDSNGCEVADGFFFRCAEPLGEGVGEVGGVSVGVAVGEDFFFRRDDVVGVGVREAFFLIVAVGDTVDFGVGVGVGDFFAGWR